MMHTRVLKTSNYCLKCFRNKEALNIMSYFYNTLKCKCFPMAKNIILNSYNTKTKNEYNQMSKYLNTPFLTRKNYFFN